MKDDQFECLLVLAMMIFPTVAELPPIAGRPVLAVVNTPRRNDPGHDQAHADWVRSRIVPAPPPPPSAPRLRLIDG